MKSPIAAVCCLATCLLAPAACDETYTCGFGPGPDDGSVATHEPSVGYETDEGRYTVTVEADAQWPPASSMVRFELWASGGADVSTLELSAGPAFRHDRDDVHEHPTVPLDASGDGSWMVGPIELDPGVWHFPLHLTDGQGSDSIELRIEVVR